MFLIKWFSRVISSIMMMLVMLATQSFCDTYSKTGPGLQSICQAITPEYGKTHLDFIQMIILFAAIIWILKFGDAVAKFVERCFAKLGFHCTY